MSTASDTIVVIQARMGSTRLPGKVLSDLGGRPMLQLQIERLLSADVGFQVVVATTDDPRDDPVAELVGVTLGLPVVRGDEHDVLGRFATALEAHPAEHIVRLTADCPLSDASIVSATVALHRVTGADYTSNVHPRSFPTGLDVEVLSADALRAAVAEATDPAEREHVTPFVLRRPERFRLATFWTDQQLSREWWTVDRPEDLERLRAMVAKLDDPTRAGWPTILSTVGRTVEPAPGELHLVIDPPPAPGSSPWVKSWTAWRDGQRVGTASVSVTGGVGTVTIDPPNDVALGAAIEAELDRDIQVASYNRPSQQ